MKKLVSLFLVTLITLTGCSGGGSAAAPAYKELDKTKEVTLKVAAWNMGTKEAPGVGQAIVDEYQKQNPNVKIEVVDMGDNYAESLTNLAAAGTLPDAFMVPKMDEAIANGWVADMKAYTEKDPEFAKIPKVITDAQYVKDKMYQIPVQINIMGIFQNLSLLEKLNVEPLKKNFTLDQMIEQAKKTTTANSIGFDNDEMLGWGGAVSGGTLKWNAFDGNKYDYANKDFSDLFNKRSELCKANAIKACAVKPPAFVSDPAVAPVASGKVVMQYDGSWANLESLDKNKWEFIGLPDDQVVVAPDFMSVSQTTKNPEWAYDFIKFVGTGSYQVRYDFAKAKNEAAPLPLIDNPDEVKLFKEAYAKQPNIITGYENVLSGSKGIVDGYKYIPGYAKSAFEADTGVAKADGSGTYTTMDLMIAASKGEVNFADYQAQMTELTNKEYEAAKATLK
ncbi:MAG: ABC transporter substrate-binding protein [Mycoplasmatales bacterium]